MNPKSSFPLALIAAIMLLVMATVACHTHKATSTPVSAKAIVSAANQPWHDLRIPVSLALEKPMAISASGRATMVRDSLVDISLRVFGFEVAAARLTPDSVFIIDKYHKYYMAEPLKQFLGSHDLSLIQVQNILLGRVESHHLEFTNRHTTAPVTIDFGDYQNTDQGPVAGTVTLNAPLNRTDIVGELEWNVNSAKWNTYPKITFASPGNNYKRITAASVRDMLRF